MLHAVVDTNILVSALLRPSGPPGVVAQSIVQGRLLPVVCAEMMAEYERVLSRPRFGFHQQEVRELLVFVDQQALWVSITPCPEELTLPDPADWPFAAAALAAGCPVITGNAKHFPRRTGVRVMTAREWADELMP